MVAVTGASEPVPSRVEADRVLVGEIPARLKGSDRSGGTRCGTGGGDSTLGVKSDLGADEFAARCAANLRPASRRPSLTSRIGFAFMRYGHDGHAIDRHLPTSSAEPAQQSRHFARITANIGIAMWPIASSSARVISRGSRPTDQPSPPISYPARCAASSWSADSVLGRTPVQTSRTRSRPRRVVTSNTTGPLNGCSLRPPARPRAAGELPQSGRCRSGRPAGRFPRSSSPAPEREGVALLGPETVRARCGSNRSSGHDSIISRPRHVVCARIEVAAGAGL